MKKQLYSTFALHSLEGLASSLIGIFIPVYLLLLGYPLSRVFIFFIVYSLSVLVFFGYSAYFSATFGIRNNFFFRLPFLMLFYLSLFFLDQGIIPLYLVAILNGMQSGFYWYPLHILFSSHAGEDKLGKNLGILYSLPKILSVFGPLLGGMVFFLGGFKILILASMSFYALTLIPLYHIKNIKVKYRLSFDVVRNFFNKYRKYFYAEIFSSMGSEIESVIFPLFVFLAFQNVVSVGAVGTLLGIGGALFTYLAGKYTDKADKKRMLKVGAIILIIIWLARFLITDQLAYFVLTVLAGFAGILIVIPFSAIFYKLSQKDKAEEFFVLREIPITIGKVGIYSIALLLAGSLKLSFLVAVLSYFYFLIY